MAEDMYTISVQALVDTSAAAQANFDASIQQLAKRTKVQINDVSVAPSALEKLGLQLAGVTKKNMQLKLDADSSSVFEVLNRIQGLAKRQGIKLDKIDVDVDAKGMLSRVQTSINQQLSSKPLAIPMTFRANLQDMARAAAKVAGPVSDEYFQKYYSQMLPRVNGVLRQNTEAEKQNAAARNANVTSMNTMLGRLSAYAFSIMHVIRYLREMVKITVDLNDAMTQLKIVTQATDEQYEKYATNMSKTATEIGIATKDLIEASTVYARLGYSLEDSSVLAKYTGMLQNVGDIEASTAQSAITSMVKAFDIDISDIESVMDKLIVVGNNFPISVSQIAEGMMNASSSLHAAGNSIEESIALLTAANTTTQNISKASTAVRTISARLRNTKAELDELGEVVTEAKYQELVDMITGQGVSLVDKQTGELRSTYAVLSDLAKIWETIGVNERAALATQIAGVRQQNVFYSILEQFQEAEQAMDAMEGSAGELDTAYGTYMESITAHVNQFKAAFQALSQTVMDSGMITKLVDIGTGFIKIFDGLSKASKQLKIFIPLLASLPLTAIITNLGKMSTIFASSSMGVGLTALFRGQYVGTGAVDPETGTRSITQGDMTRQKIAGVVAVLQLAALAVIGLKAAYDKLNVTLEEHQEKIEETESEISSIESQLEGVRDRITELKSLGPLSITDAEELSRLQGEQIALEARLATQQAILAAQKESARIRALNDSRNSEDTTKSVLEEYNAAKEAAQNPSAHNPYLKDIEDAQAALDDLIRRKKEFDALSPQEQYSSPDYGVNFAAEIQEAETALEGLKIMSERTFEDVGNDFADATENVALRIEELQLEIDNLDPERDALRIRKLREELVMLYDALGAKGASGAAFGAMLDKDAQAKVTGFVNALNRGTNLNQTFASMKNFWESDYIQGLVEEFQRLGVTIEYSDFVVWVTGMTNVGKAANNTSNTLDKTTSSLSKMLEAARTQSESLDKLKSAFDAIQDAAENGTKVDWSGILGDEKFVETFSRFDSFEEFQRLLLTTPDDIEAIGRSFRGLSKEAIFASEAAKDWTSSTKATAEALLDEKGYIDSTDLMRLAAHQDAVARASDAQADATWQSVAALRDEAAAGSLDRQVLAELAAQKALVNRTWISTSGDIDQLIALANAANATSESLIQLNNAKTMRANTDRLLASATAATASGDYAASEAAMHMAIVAAQAADTTMQRVADTITFNRLSATDFYGSGLGNYNTSTGSGGGSSSSKNVEEYIADIDQYYAALKRLESAKLSMADANRRLEATEDYNEKIRITKEIIDLYQVQADAEAKLIELRKQTIETESAGLRALGFEIEYNNKTNEFYVANLEHINDLTADSVGEYESLEEATNALRKETEDLINSLDGLNKENQEGVESLHDLSQSAKEARNSIVELYESIVKEANDVVDGFQNVYKVLTDAAKEYAQTGYLSVDSLQSILNLGPKYLAMLVDENGQLVINEQNLQAVIAAKTQDMAAETALSYAKQVLLATERGEEDVLRSLTDATAASSAATWDLAFATVGLAKALGVANGMSEEYYDNAVSYLTSMQSLTDTAVNSIPQYYETLKSSYISQADALDQILKLTQDMLKWENQQAIDALNKQKDAYADIIDQKKELLKLTKEEQDHEKDLAEKIAEIAKLQARIDQLSLDDSREAQAQKRKLEEELAKLQKGLTDDQAEYSLDVQNDALDKQLEMYENEKDDEIAALEDSLNSAEKLYQAALHELESNYGGTIERLKQWNYECGNTLQQSLLDAIDAATAALDRFGGSFSAALEGVDSYTNLGTNNTSGAATAMSASDIISAMRRNSITWWTTPNKSLEDLDKEQAALAKQYTSISGDAIYKTDNGKWHHADGDILYSLSDAEKKNIAKDIVALMKSNSAAWMTASASRRDELSADTAELGRRLGLLLGKTVTRDSNGTWWIDGKKLYDVYHSGGIVGGGALKQNEVLALLEKGEAVLDDDKQRAMYKAVDFVSTLAQKIGNAVDVSRLFGGVSPAAAGGAYASLFGRGAGVNGSLLGCNIERIDIVAPIQVVQKLDSEELKAHADMIGALSAQYIREGFTKRGVGANVTAL